MKSKYYTDGTNYFAVTGCPKGFKDVLFIVWCGPINNLEEKVLPLSALKDLTKVSTIPSEWATAFEACGVKIAKSHIEKTIQDDELLLHVAAGTDPLTALAASVPDKPVAEYPVWAPFAMLALFFIVGELIRWWIW